VKTSNTSWATLCVAAALTAAALARASDDRADQSSIRIVEHNPAADFRAWRLELREGPPVMPGFCAPVADTEPRRWPDAPPDASAPASHRRAAEIVRERLATDGLIATLAQVLAAFGPASLSRGEREDLDLLRGVGLPVDLLRYFPVEGERPGGDYGAIRYLLRRLISGAATETPAELGFKFFKTHPRFRLADESGGHPLRAVRLQLTRGDYWRGQGDGSSVDITRQLVERLPAEVHFSIFIERRFVDSFLALARTWPGLDTGRMTVYPQAIVVSQWAQDNGKAGLIAADGGGDSVATIVPRYASRGENASVFIPGDSFVTDSLAADWQTVIQSPLLFQGGNVLLAQDPQMGWRWLLLGEAEIHRNVALGLTPRQVVEAFTIEFDATRCIVLPASSYHIDYELSVRRRGSDLVAFVADPRAAARIVVRLGMSAMRHARLLATDQQRRITDYLDRGEDDEAIRVLEPLVQACATAPGRFPSSFARHFQRGLVDSGVGNLQRFLLAIDVLAGPGVGDDSSDYARATVHYRASLIRQEEDRRKIVAQLDMLRWKIVPVPTLVSESRGINYVNGIHFDGACIMPASGGFFAELDEAAAEVFRRELGPSVEVIPILCGESQRRVGAIHCAVAAYP